MIRIIPISLSILALLSINGPWNVFKISKAQQLTRLESLLTKNNLLENGKAIKASKEITIEDDVEICSIMSYIVDVHGFQNLQPYFEFNLDTIFRKDSIMYYSNYEGLNKLTEAFGIEYNLYNYSRNESDYPFSYSCKNEYNDEVLQISGYDYYLNYSTYYYNYKEEKQDTIIKNSYALPDSSAFVIAFDPNIGSLKTFINDTNITTYNLFNFLNSMNNKKSSGNNGYFQFNKSDMTLSSDSTVPAFKIIFTYISGNKKDSTFNNINDIQANVLIKLEK